MRMFLSVTFCDLEKSTERSKTSRECWKIPLLSVCWLAAFSPPWFFAADILSRRLQTHFLQSRLAGCLSAGFFSFSSNPIWKLFKQKAASHRPFFCCPDRAFAGNPHHGDSTIPNVKCVHPSPINPQPPPQTQPPNLSLTNPRDSSLIPASARRSPPSPSPRYRPHAESSHHEAVRRCTAWSTRWSLGIFVAFSSERKKGEKPPGKTGGVILKKGLNGDTPFKKKGVGDLRRDNIWLKLVWKKSNVFVTEYHLQENILKDTLLKRWGTDQLSLGCMNFTPIPAAICEKKWSNSTNLQISQNEKKSS